MLGWSWRPLRLIRGALAAGIVALLVTGASLAADTRPPPPPGLAEQALDMVATQHGLPLDEVVVVYAATAVYPQAGQTAFAFKVMDQRDGSVYLVTLDASGQPLDDAHLLAAEEAAYAARYGRLDPGLFERLANAPAEEPITVSLWLKEPPYVGPPPPDPHSPLSEVEQQAYIEQVNRQRAAAIAAVVTPVAARMLGLGYAVTTATYSPVLSAQLTPAAIREVAAWPEVDRVYGPPTGPIAPLAEARPAIGADVVHSRGITGAGVKVGQIDIGGRVATENPYLQGGTPIHWDGNPPDYLCAEPPGDHSTAVAGVIRSTHAMHRGIAPDVALWVGGSCGECCGVCCQQAVDQVQARSDAAVDWGARVLNEGAAFWYPDPPLVPAPLDRFYDDMVRNRRVTVVTPAGNEAPECGGQLTPGLGYVLSHGLAYNVITVGAFDDRNTAAWADDTMYPCSSDVDPTSTNGDREKPEVVAPGGSFTITTTSTSGSSWLVTTQGTSMAAPMVTGVVALLMQRTPNDPNPIPATIWPEAVKAMLMATAVHNIEGDARLSDRDGAGGIVADRADNVAQGLSGGWGAMQYDCSTPTPLTVATISLVAGVRTRAVLVWAQHPGSPSYASQPSADLDLVVRAPNGSLVAGSYSLDNTYEIVDFVPGSSGDYRLRVRRERCESDFPPGYLGWAWYQGE